MSALSLLKKVKIQTLSFEKHPCRELDQELMIHYLNGLALVANEDEDISEKEKEYLSILINSFGLSEDMLETFINFAENPDEKSILDMMQSFMNRDIKYNFMVDAMMIATLDDALNEKEEALINEYFEMFKLTKDEAKDLRYIYEMFYKQDGNALFRYFGKQRDDNIFIIKKELFHYLLDYYKIVVSYELTEDEKKLLDFDFFEPTFESGGLADNATEIMTKPVSNSQFCIYLNSAFIDKDIEFNTNGKIVDSETKDILMDLEMSDIEFKDNEFVVDKNEDKEKKITGVTYVIAHLFAKWVTQEEGDENYVLSYYNNYTSVESFTVKPLQEIIGSESYCDSYFMMISLKEETYLSYDYLNSLWSRKIEKTFCDKEYSFRLMKLPEGEE